MSERQLSPIERLACWVVAEQREWLADIDGGALQDEMERLGMLRKTPVTESCDPDGEGDCRCAEYGFPTECMHLAPDMVKLMHVYASEELLPQTGRLQNEEKK